MSKRRDASDPQSAATAGDDRYFAAVLEARLGRRALLQGGLGAAMTALFGGAFAAGCGPRAREARRPAHEPRAGAGLLGFQAVPASHADTVVVPPGYSVHVLGPWGEPIVADGPAFAITNTGADQARQIGSHHDGMHFFPIEGAQPFAGSSDEGLLVLNHEYIEPRLMHASARGAALDRNGVPMNADGTRDPDEVLKEISAHGVSIYRITKGADGRWGIVFDARNRRITGLTPMELHGPVRGSELVKTRYSPEGHATRGTLNNCSHGVTPWNTYLAAEENWAGYFCNADETLPREHARYGVRAGKDARYQWHKASNSADEYIRFDATRQGEKGSGDYRNEPNCFGWVVEIDPFDPESVPKKRTALGRFAHEGVVFQPPREGSPVVCYSGDDSQFEYIYKYVSRAPYERATAGGHLLDDGTLHVARFNADGTGDWLPLVHGQGGLTEQSGFADQAEVLINTRAAADFVGATKMDRPEWGAVDRTTGHVYFTLTNNTRRDAEQADAANPRGPNLHGHIVRWRELSDDAAGLRFEWDLFAMGGEAGGPNSEAVGRDPAGRPLTEDNHFSAPDGLWIDPDRRVWILTDMGEDALIGDARYASFGNNQMLAADPDTGELRRFLTGPVGQEITGVITTPDQRTMFVNVQHPGSTTTAEEFADGKLRSRWPDGDLGGDGAYPRSATLVIWKDDGGVIGS